MNTYYDFYKNILSLSEKVTLCLVGLSMMITVSHPGMMVISSHAQSGISPPLPYRVTIIGQSVQSHIVVKDFTVTDVTRLTIKWTMLINVKHTTQTLTSYISDHIQMFFPTCITLTYNIKT